MHVILPAVLAAMLFGIVCATSFAAKPQDFDSAGVSIHYFIDSGGADPVVLIHGFTGSLRMWDGLRAKLSADGFRAIGYDARGHGNSGKPTDAGQYGQADVDDLLRLLNHLGLSRVHLVGYSRGASIASRFVVQHPSRVRSVVLAAWGVDNPMETRTSADCEADAAAALSGHGQTAAGPLGRPLRSQRDPAALAAMLRAECRTSRATIAELAATGVPMRAIVGADDGMAPAAIATQKRIPTMEIVVVPAADHVGLPNHARFTDGVLEFLWRHREQAR